MIPILQTCESEIDYLKLVHYLLCYHLLCICIRGPSYYLICIFWAFQANLICSSNCNRTILVQLKTRPSVVLKSAYHASKPNWAKLRAADLALSKLICWTRWTYLKLSCFGSNLLIIMLFQTHLIDSYTILRPIWETYDSQIICKFHYV